jgi:hypothetical protein
MTTEAMTEAAVAWARCVGAGEDLLLEIRYVRGRIPATLREALALAVVYATEDMIRAEDPLDRDAAVAARIGAMAALLVQPCR